MYFIKFKYNIFYKIIGFLFNDRDYFIVLFVCEKVECDMRMDLNLKFVVDLIVKKIDLLLLK